MKKTTKKQKDVKPHEIRGYIEHISDNDVLFGRGHKIDNHFGNKQLKQIVKKNFLDHSNQRTDKGKQEICINIRIIIEKQLKGRFLRKSEINNIWFEVGNRKAQQKIAACFRDLKRLQNKQKKEPRKEEEQKQEEQYFRSNEVNNFVRKEGKGNEYRDGIKNEPINRNVFDNIPSVIKIPQFPVIEEEESSLVDRTGAVWQENITIGANNDIPQGITCNNNDEIQNDDLDDLSYATMNIDESSIQTFKTYIVEENKPFEAINSTPEITTADYKNVAETLISMGAN